MMRLLSTSFVTIVLALTMGAGEVFAGCDINCNKKCCTKIAGTRICEPGCLGTCEATKHTCKRVEEACAAVYDGIMDAGVIRGQGFDAAQFNQPLIPEAKSWLVQIGEFDRDTLDRQYISWCGLSGDTLGQAPDRNKTCISHVLKDDLLETTVTLAHEMKHQEQFVRLGTNTFKCEYGKEHTRCGGGDNGSSRCNLYEKEAYDYDERVRLQLIRSPFNSFASQRSNASVAGLCPREETLRSLDARQPVSVRFENTSTQTVSVYWLDYNGKRTKYADLAPNTSYVQQTFATHPWIALNPQGQCFGPFLPEERNRVTIR